LHRTTRICDPLGAAYLRRGAGEPCLSLVLQARHRGQYPRPFGVLPCTARTFSRERRPAPGIPGRGGDVHRGWACWWPSVPNSGRASHRKSAERLWRGLLSIRRRHVLCPAQRVALVIHSLLAQCLISVATQGVDVGEHILPRLFGPGAAYHSFGWAEFAAYDPGVTA